MITVVSSIIEKDCYFLKAKFEALFVLDLSCFIYLPCTYDNDPDLPGRTLLQNMASYIYVPRLNSTAIEDDNLDN